MVATSCGLQCCKVCPFLKHEGSDVSCFMKELLSAPDGYFQSVTFDGNFLPSSHKKPEIRLKRGNNVTLR